MNEIWKTCKYCGDYEVSNYGRVKSLKRGKTKLLSLSKTQDGYVKCSLYYNNSAHCFRVNRLVAEHFIENPNNKPTVNHIDGNKENNRADNLEWATLSEQMKHAYSNGLKQPMSGLNNYRSKLTADDVRYIRKNYKAHSKEFGMLALAEKFNVSPVCIKRAYNRITYKDVE